MRLPGNPTRRRERPGGAGAGGCELPAPPLGAPAARRAPRTPRQRLSARDRERRGTVSARDGERPSEGARATQRERSSSREGQRSLASQSPQVESPSPCGDADRGGPAPTQVPLSPHPTPSLPERAVQQQRRCRAIDPEAALMKRRAGLGIEVSTIIFFCLYVPEKKQRR